MDGIVRGLEHKKHRPVVDGIVCGIARKSHLKAAPELHRVAPSATQNSEGVYGSGRTPEGDGDLKSRGIKLAHHAEGDGTKKGMVRKTARLAYEQKHKEAHNA
jgi:hypothetical protein